MRKNNLTSNKGLSLSQAQSISNLCFQRATEISHLLTYVNNYSKSVKINDNYHIIVKGNILPTNVVDLLKEKAELHACQAFLMENIKAKDTLLNEIRKEVADVSMVDLPEKINLVNFNYKKLPEVTEEFGWEQLTTAEYNEYLEAEAFASHIGQYIHKDGVLTHLRNELPNIPAIEWMEVEKDKKTPVTITVHHDPKNLLEIHENLAALHRQYEQRVNYFKAKVKNITTEENARIAKHNADLQTEAKKLNSVMLNAYETAVNKANEEISSIRAEFEKIRQEKIKTVAGMRIDVDSRFQKVINVFLNQLPKQE